MSADLKHLQTRMNEASATVKRLDDEIGRLKQERGNALSLANNLRQQIAKLTEKEIVVSEHAMLRYLERGAGQSLEDIKAQILTPQVEKCIRTLGNGTFPIGHGGLRAVVRDRVVVSVLGVSEK